MIATQMGFNPDGGRFHKRLVSWKALLEGRVKQIWNLRTDLSDEDKNKLIIGSTLCDMAEIVELVGNIQTAPTKEIGQKLLKAFFIRDDVPSLETLARGLRSAKKDLRETHPDFLNRTKIQEKELTYDELLIEISECTTERDSTLEHRFGVFLKQNILDYHFDHNATVSNGNNEKLNVDYVLRQRGLVIEIDGYEYHRDYHSFITDRQKWRKLRQWGYDVLPFAAAELTIRGGFYNALDAIRWWIDKKSNS